MNSLKEGHSVVVVADIAAPYNLRQDLLPAIGFSQGIGIEFILHRQKAQGSEHGVEEGWVPR